MADKLSLTTCLQYVCGLTGREVASIVNQGYNNACCSRQIDPDSLIELLSVNKVLEYMKVSSKKNIQALHVWLQDCNPNNIDLVKFDDAMLETYCEALFSKKGPPYRLVSTYKSQDKIEIWEG